MRSYNHFVGGGAPFSHPPVRTSLGALRAGPAAFYNSAGTPISSIGCGQPYTFAVTGYSQVWLVQTHNGTPQYNGVLPVPMAPYTANCSSEPGLYQAMVYTVVNGQQGQFIGSTSLSVLSNAAAPTSSAAPTSTPNAPAAGGTSTTTTSTTTTSSSGGGGGVPSMVAQPVSIAAAAPDGVTLTPTMLIGLGLLAVVFFGMD